MAYVPRICSFTKKPIASSDKASVQLTFAHLDDNGRATDKLIVLNACGKIRKEGKVDEILSQINQ